MGTEAALATRISQRASARYGIALLAVFLALAIRWALIPLFGTNLPYVTLFPAIAFAALYCGIGPSIISVVIALVGAKYWFIAPLHSLGPPARGDLIGMLIFLLACGAIVIFGEAQRRNHNLMLRAQDDLEERVRRRTAELNSANQSLRHLTARLLEIQDEERRRFARELHDSAGQTLTALAMNLATVQSEIERLTKTSSAIQDSTALVQDLSKEIRTISHLLHPPLLDEAGLASALSWYVDGFAERSGIKVDLQFSQEFARLPREAEITIFRVVQECLTNIHRHSGSPSATIRLSRTGHAIRVEIQDKGKGIPPEQQSKLASAGAPGVGIRGMRERLRQLGGNLEIDSSAKGTLVLVTLPIASASAIAAAD